jgi:large subunit ribosomal protein L13
MINFSGKSIFPKIPDREPIPAKENRVQNYDYLTAADYRRLFEDEEETEKIARTAYLSMEHEGKIYHLFDACKIPFGKIIQPAVYLLQGKHKPNYRRNEINKEDVVVIVNASEMFLTGRKMFYKKVKYHTGYIGHLRNVDYKHYMQHKPE